MVQVYKNESARKAVIESYNRILDMWEAPYEENDIQTSYGLTHCITSGDAGSPPLLLFHGVGDNSAVMWALNIRELSRHFYCIAVDTIGGPGKSVPNEKFNKQTFNPMKWIDQILDHFQINTVNIAGVSNGAYIAYHYTTVRCDRVRRAVCLEGGMVTSPLKSMVQTLLILFPEILIPTNRNLHKVLKKLSSPGADVFDRYPLLAEHLVLLMKSHNQQAMFVHKLEKYDPSKADAVKEKLIFLIADHNIRLKKDLMAVLNRDGFRYKIVPDAGHGINHEQPEIVHREIIGFLL
ncbi:alpha/beta fold hydrolase [Paenibacillus sp. GCM10012303]|uniref:alpha/beta fold hydrolase n=1 Tax=Paenibacillus sp. GCM10012303 TaxID=3317340 RepID=UPI00360D8BF3